jgi:hypothetical protein
VTDGDPPVAKLDASRAVGVAACAAAVLACVGACAPWFSISLFTVTAHIGGLNSHLDGRYALALGLVGLALGVLIVRDAVHLSVRRALALALVIVGLGGVAMVWHQDVHLVHNASTVGRTTGLTPFAKYFDVHAGAAWGLWLTGASFTCLAIAGAMSAFTGRGYNSRSAPPSTGITQPVRYEAADESTNAATRPNSSASP